MLHNYLWKYKNKLKYIKMCRYFLMIPVFCSISLSASDSRMARIPSYYYLNYYIILRNHFNTYVLLGIFSIDVSLEIIISLSERKRKMTLKWSICILNYQRISVMKMISNDVTM